MPAKTVNGAELESVSEVEILRNGEPATTITDAAPGKNVSWTDENSVRGEVSYTVTVYNGTLKSLAPDCERVRRALRRRKRSATSL